MRGNLVSLFSARPSMGYRSSADFFLNIGRQNTLYIRRISRDFQIFCKLGQVLKN